jgi:hypothetical protein
MKFVIHPLVLHGIEGSISQLLPFNVSTPHLIRPLFLLRKEGLKAHIIVSEPSILHITLLSTGAPRSQPVVVETVRPSQKLSIPARRFHRSRTANLRTSVEKGTRFETA